MVNIEIDNKFIYYRFDSLVFNLKKFKYVLDNKIFLFSKIWFLILILIDFKYIY